MLSKLKNEGKSFLECVSKSNEVFFFSLFCLYVISNVVGLVNWRSDISHYAGKAHFFMFAAVMWGSAILLFSIIVEWRNAWKRTGELILIGVLVFALAGIISKLVTSDSYAFVMGAFFCIMACGKKYKKILMTFLIIITATLIIAYICMKFGITFDAVKPYRVYGGHSLGIKYPNDWGYFVFNIMMIIWYMILRRKKIVTVIVFWAVSIFMYKYITCQTIALMAFLFPGVAIIAELFQDKYSENYNRFLNRIIIFLPWIIMAVMLIGCWQMDWIHKTFYDTRLESMAMRFVEGGYFLLNNKVTLFGSPFNQWNKSLVDYSSDIDMIVDSAFICYLIIRGIVAMVLTLGWISYAHKRCLERRDYRLIGISFFMLLFSMMERPGLDAWYNFVLLYPLSRIPDSKQVI